MLQLRQRTLRFSNLALCYRHRPTEPSAVIVDSPQNLDDLKPATSPEPRRWAESLLSLFQASFPGIGYELAWYSDSVNAQAFVYRNRKRVRLFGGLARHRRISRAGIAFALAHETGHHLAGAPFDPTYFWLSSESRADEWALREGMIHAFGPRRGRAMALKGLRELVALSPVGDASRAARQQLLNDCSPG